VSDVSDRLAAAAPSEQTLLGHLFWLSRPRFWFYLAGPVVVGVVYGTSTTGEFIQPVTAALFVYFLVPANVFLYGINDVFDADIDALNPKKSADGRELRYSGDRRVTVAVALAAALGVAFAPILPLKALTALTGFFLLGIAYSAPPVRFKTTPLLDSVSNGLYVLPAVVAFAAVSDAFPPALTVAGGWIWAMGMHTFSAIPDIEPDRKAGIHTTATVLGKSRTLVYCAGCWLGAAVLMGLHHPLLAGIFAVYPLFVAGIIAGDIDIARAYWWFPVLNMLAGTVLTLGGIWVILHG
jgi:4-hydroxybenzoate polyprenyltransferase